MNIHLKNTEEICDRCANLLRMKVWVQVQGPALPCLVLVLGLVLSKYIHMYVPFKQPYRSTEV